MFARVQLLFLHLAVVSFLLHHETCARNTSDLVGVVRNLRVTVLQTRDYVERKDVYTFLKLNISWSPPSTVRQPSFYSVIVTGIREKKGTTECTEGSLFHVYDNKRFNAVLPEHTNFIDVPDLYIQPNCSYKVQVIANPSMNYGSNSSEVLFTVPECVGLTCNCIHAKSSIPIPKVNVSQTENRVIVNWSPNVNATNVQYYAISVGVPVSKSTKGLPVYNVTKVGQVLANKTTFVSNFKPNASNYKIVVSAIDIHGCTGPEGSLIIRSLDNHIENHNVLFIVIGVICSCILLGILALILYYKHSFFMKSNFIECKSQWMEKILKKHNILYIRHELQDEYTKEMDKSNLLFKSVKLIRELGTGQFGMVYLGQLDDANDTLVAVKMSQNMDIENREQFIQEIEMMKMAGNHPHLVNLIGYCTQPTQPICILLEYMQGGDLLTYLHRQKQQLNIKVEYQNQDIIQDLCRPRITQSLYTAISDTVNSYKLRYYTNIASKDETVVETEIRIGKMEMHRFLKFAKEIAMGMEHLEALGIIHRDLAARNILLSADLTVKISDFGLSRNGIYVIRNTEGKVRRLPIRWMSPEALYDRTFSSKSDVWSFGVVLWEMSTLGGFPYSNVQDDRLLRYVIHENGRLEQPEGVPTNVYKLMDSCWAKEPEDRPHFAQLLSAIRTLTSSPDDTVQTVSNPCYEFLDSNKIT